MFPGVRAEPVPPPTPSISAFHREVMSQDLVSAACLLQVILGIDAMSAADCTVYYADKITMDPEHVRETMNLHEVIGGGSQADVLITLKRCFNLHGAEALDACRRLQRLRRAR